MKSGRKKLIRTLLVVGAVAFVGVLIGVIPISAGFIKAPIENAMRKATGLDLSVGDSIIVRLGSTPMVTTGNLSISDPSGRSLLTVDALNAKIGLFPLFSDRIHLRQLTVTGVGVDYCSQLPQQSSETSEEKDERSPDASDEAVTMSVVVDQADVDDIVFRCGTAAENDDFEINLRHVSASAPEHESMHLEAEGSVRGIDVDFTLTGGVLASLLDEPVSIPLELSLITKLVEIDISGELHMPLDNPVIEAGFDLRSSDVQLLSPAIGFDLPALGALQVAGRVRGSPASIDVIELVGELGESRINADVSVNLTGERPYVDLLAELQQLDLGPFLDPDPSALPTAGNTNFADVDLQPTLDLMGEIDADVQVSIETVLGVPIQMDAIQGNARLANGVVELQALTAEAYGAEVFIDGRFDSRSECPELQLRASASDLDLAIVNQWLILDEAVGGKVAGIGLETSSCGDHLFAHRDSVHAKAEFLGGRISFGNNALPLTIEELHTNIAYSERGRARLVGEFANEAVQATLAVGSLQALLGGDTWPVEIDLQGAGSRLQLSGQAGPLTDQFVLDAPIRFDVPQVGTLHTWSSGPPDALLPLHASLQLHFDASSLVADSIAIQFGQSDLGGRLIWGRAQDSAVFAVTTQSNYFDLDEIFAALIAIADEPDPIVHSGATADTFTIPPGYKIPPIDLDLKFGAVNFRGLDVQNVDLSGRLRDGLIDDASVSALVEDEVLLNGSLDLDLLSAPATGSLNVAAGNVNIGGLLGKLNLTDDLQLTTDEIEIVVTAAGATPREFILDAFLQADMRGFQWNIPGAESTAENGLRDSFELSLAEVKLSARPGQSTTWESHGEAAGVPVEVLLRMPSLQETFGDAPELPLTLVAASGDNVAMIDARIDLSAEQNLLADVVMSGAVVESQSRVLAELRSPLADYEFSSDVALTKDEWRLPNLNMRLGSSVVSGSFSMKSGDDRRRTEVKLHAPILQTDDMLYWTTDFLAAAGGGDDQLSDGELTGAGVKSDRGFLVVLGDYITEFRKSNDLDLNIIVDELYAGTDRMGGAELHLYVDEDEFLLKPLKITSAAGDVDAEYGWNYLNGRINIGMKVHADAIHYGGLLRLIDHESEARGVLYLDTDISAQTDWVPDIAALELLLKNANGNFDLAAWPENADAGLLDLWTANLVLALLPQPTVEQSNVLNCLAMRLEVEDGVLQTGTALMDSTTTIIRGRGKIDLAQQQLELLVAPQAKREKFLSMSTPVMVTGPFDDFQIGVEPAGIVGTAMKWWMSLIYVPFKWLTGERYPADGTATCFDAMDWELTPDLQDYFLQLNAGAEAN